MFCAYLIKHFGSVYYTSKCINSCNKLLLRLSDITSTDILGILWLSLLVILCRKEANKKRFFELRPYYVSMLDMLLANSTEATNWFKIFDPPSKKPQTSKNILINFVIQYNTHPVRILCFNDCGAVVDIKIKITSWYFENASKE